jgi:hypothetical protein
MLGRYSPPRPLPEDCFKVDRTITYPASVSYEYTYQHPPLALKIDELCKAQARVHPGKPMLIKAVNTSSQFRERSGSVPIIEWNPHLKSPPLIRGEFIISSS